MAVKMSFLRKGDHGGWRLGFVYFDFGVPPVCPFAMPSLPNFHLPKQNLSDRGTSQIKANKMLSQTTKVTLSRVCLSVHPNLFWLKPDELLDLLLSGLLPGPGAPPLLLLLPLRLGQPRLQLWLVPLQVGVLIPHAYEVASELREERNDSPNNKGSYEKSTELCKNIPAKFRESPQNVPLFTSKMHYGAIF